MNNVTIAVGRLVSDPKITENSNNKKECNITLAVPRDYYNQDGIYETDFIPATLYGTLAENTAEFCRKGNIIGIKGRIETIDGKLKVVADKVTFLARKEEI